MDQKDLKKMVKKFIQHKNQNLYLHRVLLASSNKNDMILDPFLGSGTTATVAKKLSRNYYGIEKEKNYILRLQNKELKNTKPIEDELLRYS